MDACIQRINIYNTTFTYTKYESTLSYTEYTAYTTQEKISALKQQQKRFKQRTDMQRTAKPVNR